MRTEDSLPQDSFPGLDDSKFKLAAIPSVGIFVSNASQIMSYLLVSVAFVCFVSSCLRVLCFSLLVVLLVSPLVVLLRAFFLPLLLLLSKWILRFCQLSVLQYPVFASVSTCRDT